MTTDATAGPAPEADAERRSGLSATETDSESDRVAPVVAAIREEAAAVKRRELDEALGRLETSGELTAKDRAAVESLADALVRELLAVPVGSLSGASDVETRAAALRLFGRDCATAADPESTVGSAPTGGDSR